MNLPKSMQDASNLSYFTEAGLGAGWYDDPSKCRNTLIFNHVEPRLLYLLYCLWDCNTLQA